MKTDTNLIFEMPQPETELARICREVLDIAEQDPAILALIALDQDQEAKERKKLRLLDKQWEEKHLTPFPGFGSCADVAINAEALIITQSKKRMAPIVVLFFMILRGYIGGFKAKATQTLIGESMTVFNFFEQRGIRMPKWSTIIDHVNQVSNATRSHILDFQLSQIIGEKLDDFKELYIDSTAVSGNVSWPTDSRIILQLVQRLWTCGQKLESFGLQNIAPRRFASIIKRLSHYHKTISMSVGKKNSKKKIKKIYGKLLKEARSALAAYQGEIVTINQAVVAADLIPSKQLQLTRLVELMISDKEKLSQVIGYCSGRINLHKTFKAKDKIMSNSDPSASLIQKGQREAVVGYKPQIGRSRKGFITAIDVPDYNAADSDKFEPMVEQHIQRSGIVPIIVSVDDGYASLKGKESVEKKGVAVVSINGAKGKKITSEQDWESDPFKEARNQRSSVESLMYTIKHNHHFGRVMRRGIEAVKAELLEKVLAYNFCRIIEVRENKEAEKPLIRQNNVLNAA